MKYFFKIFIFVFFTFSFCLAEKYENCEWDKKDTIPCLTIQKIPNTSIYSENGVGKITITKQDILNSGAQDLKSILDKIPGLDLKQNGQAGQLTSLFSRGTNSNHTLYFINGVAINDQSTTQGLHNFGQDFVQTLQQIEIYKGPNGAHFGPSAIGGAINLITDVDYQNNLNVNGYNFLNNSVDGNYTMVTDNGWTLNFKGGLNKTKTGSARHGGAEDDAAENAQFNFNSYKFLNENLKIKSMFYSRKTEADYDGSSSDENGYNADDKMYAIQTGIEYKKNNLEDSLVLHYNNYDRQYENGGYLDTYYSESFITKGERSIKYSNKLSFGFGTEYKYDWANFTDNGSWSTPSAKGFIDNLGVFGNFGYLLDNSTNLSAFSRIDDHKTTGTNLTYKVSLNKNFDNFNFNITHATGLRNPSLYELYGHNGRSDSYKHVANRNAKPEKSKVNESTLGYQLSKYFSISSTAYRSSIQDALLYDSNFNGGSGYTNTKQDLKQKGLETNLIYKSKIQSISLFNTITSSKKKDGSHQLNRPDSTYGLNYFRIFDSKFLGKFKLNYDYKHYGKAFDYDPGIKKVDSTDIMNLSVSKEILNMNWSLNLKNILDEHYQRPVGYGQNGRNFSLSLRQSF